MRHELVRKFRDPFPINFDRPVHFSSNIDIVTIFNVISDPVRYASSELIGLRDVLNLKSRLYKGVAQTCVCPGELGIECDRPLVMGNSLGGVAPIPGFLTEAKALQSLQRRTVSNVQRPVKL